MNAAYIIAARRTPVAPRNGAFRHVEAADLAAATIRAMLKDAGVEGAEIDEVILGNALYGGGNPARVAALAAGLPESVPALSVDTQCCAGLDAILLAASRIAAGEANAIIAGGVESYSRAPLRAYRPRKAGEEPRSYARPPFTPWPDRDPDMIEAAAVLSSRLHITRTEQEAFAIGSHDRALATVVAAGELVAIGKTTHDTFTRRLTAQLCARLPALAGEAEFALTAATVAPAADAAAAVLVASEEFARRAAAPGKPVRILGGIRLGGDPEAPGLAPIAAVRKVLERCGLDGGDIHVAEIMEAFAVQTLACIGGAGLHPACVNRSGGALARGHPIGASGAILAVRLWHELQTERVGANGLAAIAGAGGLASAMLVTAKS